MRSFNPSGTGFLNKSHFVWFLACMYLLLLIAVYKPNCLSGTLKWYSALLLSKWFVCVIISYCT